MKRFLYLLHYAFCVLLQVANCTLTKYDRGQLVTIESNFVFFWLTFQFIFFYYSTINFIGANIMSVVNICIPVYMVMWHIVDYFTLLNECINWNEQIYLRGG